MSTKFPKLTKYIITKSTHGYRCAGSREVTSLRCLVHESLTSLFIMAMAFNYKMINVYSYKISYQSVDANLFYSIFIRTFRSPLVHVFVYNGNHGIKKNNNKMENYMCVKLCEKHRYISKNIIQDWW